METCCLSLIHDEKMSLLWRLFLNLVPYFLWTVTVEPITCQCEFVNWISYFKVLFILGFFLAAFTFSHIFELIIQPELTSLSSFRQFNLLKMFYISKYTHDTFWWVKSWTFTRRLLYSVWSRKHWSSGSWEFSCASCRSHTEFVVIHETASCWRPDDLQPQITTRSLQWFCYCQQTLLSSAGRENIS